jgi:hypothetical protein
MAANKTDIIVYAHWHGIPEPLKMGVLSAQEARGNLAWSFAYDEEWLDTQSQLLLDPDLQWYTGPQYFPDHKPKLNKSQGITTLFSQNDSTVPVTSAFILLLQ